MAFRFAFEPEGRQGLNLLGNPNSALSGYVCLCSSRQSFNYVDSAWWSSSCRVIRDCYCGVAGFCHFCPPPEIYTRDSVGSFQELPGA